MKRLELWTRLQYERKMDNRHPGQPAPPARDYTAGQAAAFADVLDALQLLVEKE
ncbi:hypothetical protein ACPV6D_05110 [Corynebacterium propinquum]|uniref:hypothetical protein n=1 Tax=Corynebacterium propinquum TaxID=43769 RepID=UPI003C84042D